ncbi:MULTISPECIES: hypothetical protein [unclassified Ruegeria]|uniref:hypothetical protein n=1 Tax=unclassified Ruegeria TaxID=2625375 RepID=UPI001489567E|nr:MULTISPECIES: hypothetical protein [unclassified Ruegeria]NOD49464.1 hypothetical protein [Ruegeria sp. HKCCD5849]NOD53777.1 hypothetical protein [Ruegeria sp. HKCCD5851]NOD69792.1 hypothetical protein [Ruegeria sp. HKCCD7303]NOE35421.1 hypothetical protein [Ruegeria sp. HKCCD7318]
MGKIDLFDFNRLSLHQIIEKQEVLLGSSISDEAMARLPFWVTPPGETDGFLIVVGILLVVVLLGFGALYFTVQAIPDRMAAGAHKVQMQLVGVLGLISLFTLNNAFWIAAILIAAVPLHEILPLKSDVDLSESQDA